MAPLSNGMPNGTPRKAAADSYEPIERFSDIPSALDIQVSGGDAEEAVEISLEDLLDDPTELCTLLENENAEKRTWTIIALAYARQKKVDLAIDILQKGLLSLSRGNPKEKLGPMSLLCWMYLGKCRAAPRILPEDRTSSDIQTKEHWLQAATGVLNEAARINPAYPPLYLARGVLYLLRASLQPPAKPVALGSIDHSERVESLRLAQKCFDDAGKVAIGRNMMAAMGSARALYSLGRYSEALHQYQQVLAKMPNLVDPDPRVGIGCCLWQLGHKQEARDAWERVLQLNPDSPIGTILMGLYYLNESSNFATTDPGFAPLYKKAMTEYTQKAYKLAKDMPLTAVTFGGYFSLRKTWQTVEALSKKAIELTDVNAIASDGWYQLARKEHHQDSGDLTKTNDFYSRADAARGGGDRGYIPARFGIAQVLILQGDIDGAKFRLEKIIQNSRSTEAMMLLGALLAEEVFKSQDLGSKEDISAIAKKAVALLEGVRIAWKDQSKKVTPDVSVLVYLACLYEVDQPEKALQCLVQVEKMNMEDTLDEEGSKLTDVDEERIKQLREGLSPQLLNNLGCFHYHAERYDRARECFQAALNSSIRFGEKDRSIDADALATSISFNLARTVEATGKASEARQIYESLLNRHNNYTDAKVRLAYIDHREDPMGDGPQAMAALNETDGANLEVRSLLGWYLSKSKKRASNIAEDQEQKHYKKTLVDFDKHDRYSLTGMGNLYSTYAREMRRSTEKEREKRSAEYLRAVGYFDKVLQLDPQNAYAAQGIAIALAEDKKEFSTAVHIFSKIKETIKDSSVLINLGHIFCELKQYSRSIENYEAALRKDRGGDATVLACVGRVWFFKGKQDKSVDAMKTALEYSRKALSISPSQIHFRFNIAFVQIQLAQLLYTLPEHLRTLAGVQEAAEGLEEAIEALYDIANSEYPPYPKHDIEQRANMGRNTMTKQLERAVQAQREYEHKNAARLEAAKKQREETMQKREEERKKAEDAVAEEKRRIQEERQKMLETSRALAERRAEEEQKMLDAEMTTDSETGQKIKRKRKPRPSTGAPRRKKGADATTDASGSDGEARPTRRRKKARKSGAGKASSGVDSTDDEGARPSKKKRRLARKEDKYKSSERIVDSDEDDDLDGVVAPANGENTPDEAEDEDVGDEDIHMSDASADDDAITGDKAARTTNESEKHQDDEEADVSSRRTSRKAARRIDSDDDEDDEDELSKGTKANGNAFADKPDPSIGDEAAVAAGGSDDGGDEGVAMGRSAADGFGA